MSDHAPPHLPSTPPAPNFDRIARLYRWAEYLSLGPLLTRTREHLLPQITSARHALVLGDGDGRFLAKLLRAAPHLHATAVDTSASMLHLLRQRCHFAAPRLTTLHAAALNLPPDLALRQTDLIVTHFFLDCLTQPELNALTAHLAAAVAPGCHWLLSDFGLPRRHPWRALASLYLRSLYLAFRLLTNLRPQTLPDIANTLHSAGFRRIHRAERLAGLLYSEIWQLQRRP